MLVKLFGQLNVNFLIVKSFKLQRNASGAIFKKIQGQNLQFFQSFLTRTLMIVLNWLFF